MNNNQTNLRIAPPSLRLFYLTVGLLGLLAYRSIIILNNISGFWVSLAWYVGTFGYIIFYIHRYQISKKRREVIKQFKLDEKVELLDALGVQDKEALHYVLESLESSNERWNYLLTFIFTALTLVAGIVIDIVNQGL